MYSLRLRMLTPIVAFIVFSFALSTGRFSNANPTTVDTDKSLSTHSTLKGVPELVAEAEKIEAELTALAEEIDRVTVSGNMERLPGKKLATSIPKLRQAYRNQAQLQILGEPLGIDLEMRLRVSDHKIQNACLAYAATPAGTKVRNALAIKLQKDQPKRLEQYQKIIQLASEKKFQEAESLLNTIGDELTTELWFLPLTVRTPFLNPYSQAASTVEGPMRNLRSAAANSEMNQVIARIKPDPAALDTWGRDIVGQIRSSGTAAWNDRSPVGPVEAFDDLMRRWKIGHTALQRIAALQWVVRRNGGTVNASNSIGIESSSGGIEATSNTADSVDPFAMIVADAIRWNDAAMLAAIEIIKADATKIAPEAIPMRHQAYMERLGAIMSGVHSDSVKPRFEEALGSLVKGNSVYAESAKQYAAATKDIMIFRARIAKDQAERLGKDFPPADAMVREATTADPECLGLYSGNQQQLATLYEPAKKIMGLRGPRIINRNVRIDHVGTFSGQNPISLSNFSGRTYGGYSTVIPTGAATDSLKADLLVDQSYRPLSLDAARAIQNAEVGNFVAVGGKVTAAQLESIITRFASLGLVESAIVPSGSVVPMQNNVDPITQMAIRLQLAPTWVHHEMFVATVPGPQ